MIKTMAILSVCAITAFLAVSQTSAKGLDTVGLYSFKGARQYHKYWKAAGYNTLQLIDHGFSAPPEDLDSYYKGVAKDIKEAQQDGFKVYVIILSNVSKYPDYPFKASVFDPSDPEAMKDRMQYIERTVKALKGADGFSFFGGDPGGSPKKLGADGVPAWVKMTNDVHAIVKREAPKAQFNANIWAVTAWEDITINPFKADFWIKEVEYGKALTGLKGFIGPDCGVEFPMHNYYRSLALKAYEDAGKKPELYPVSADVKKLKTQGVKRIWGWAHFLIDEVDDGYTGYSGVKSHPAQSETRYLHKIIADARKIGMNGMISDIDVNAGMQPEALNVYTFARFANDPSLTPEKAIMEFSGLIATPETKTHLSQVLQFIENNSTWQASIPEKYRLPNFNCSISTAAQALDTLNKVKPLKVTKLKMPEPPAKYIERLRSRLNDITAAESK